MNATVFVRNLPLDQPLLWIKNKLTECLQQYGPIQSARLVTDKDSKKPKGTAFVDFLHDTRCGLPPPWLLSL